jgi:hypothetical protein
MKTNCNSNINKKGQVYLIAAVVIIGLILGYVTVTNAFKGKDTDTRIFDLRDELNIEAGEVIDFGIFKENKDGISTSGQTFPSLNDLILDFTDTYNEYAGEGRDLFFVFGTDEGITVVSYQEHTSGSVEVGGSKIDLVDEKRSVINPGEGDDIKIITGEGDDEDEYNFELSEGENFYFVISERRGGEEFVTKG